MYAPLIRPSHPAPAEAVLKGRCWVIDGDTIVINKVHIRLAGIDAPELDHPWGQQAKRALVKLCKGQTITARLRPEMSYHRAVGECFLPDGRDLAAEMVRCGLALDWAKFSRGKYRHLEPDGVRKKLWRASVRQGGLASFLNEGAMPQRPAVPPSRRRYSVRSPAPIPAVLRRQSWSRLGWPIVPSLLLLLIGCSLDQSKTKQNAPQALRQVAPIPARFVVTAASLNVRAEPRANAAVIASLAAGAQVAPDQMSGHWYGFPLSDGSTGWVYGDYLDLVAQ